MYTTVEKRVTFKNLSVEKNGHTLNNVTVEKMVTLKKCRSVLKMGHT